MGLVDKAVSNHIGLYYRDIVPLWSAVEVHMQQARAIVS